MGRMVAQCYIVVAHGKSDRITTDGTASAARSALRVTECIVFFGFVCARGSKPVSTVAGKRD
jgi:hypothetical protein